MRTPYQSLAASLLAVATIVAACTGDGGGNVTQSATPAPSPSPSPSPAPDATGTLMFARGSDVLRYDIGRDQREVITLRGENHSVSPDGSRIVYEFPPPPDEEIDPTLELIDIDDPYDISVLGWGREPVWSPDSELIAALLISFGNPVCPADVERIPKDARDDQGCTETENVTVFEGSAGAGGASPDLLFDLDLWRILGWTDDDRILVRSLTDGHASLGAPGASDAESETLQAPPWRVRDVSPAELMLLVQRRRGVFLQPAFGKADQIRLELETRDEVQLDLPEGTRVTDSSFSPDGAHVALIVESEDLPPRVVLAETESGWVSPEITFVADPEGPLLWHPDGSRFAFVAAGASGHGSRVAVCSLDLYCGEAYSAGRPIRLLWFGHGELPESPETPRP